MKPANIKKKICMAATACMVMIIILTGCNKNKQIASSEETTHYIQENSEKQSEKNVAESIQQDDTAEQPTTKQIPTTPEEVTQQETTQQVTQPETQAATQQITQPETQAATQQVTQPETQPAPTQKATQPETERYIVDIVVDKETSGTEPVKYGVTRTAYIEKSYYVYSDNSKELFNTYTYYTYDCSGYNASCNDLKAESESVAAANKSYSEEILRLVNEIREEAGVAPLTLDDTLCKGSTMRAVEMAYADCFSHTRPDGSSCFSLLSYYNISYSAAGENIAAGYSTPEAAVEAWKNSEGHYANMIDESFTKLGVGYFQSEIGSWGNYWVQTFTN